MLLVSVSAVVLVDNDDVNQMYDFSLPKSNLKGLPHTMQYMVIIPLGANFGNCYWTKKNDST